MSKDVAIPASVDIHYVSHNSDGSIEIDIYVGNDGGRSVNTVRLKPTERVVVPIACVPCQIKRIKPDGPAEVRVPL